MARLEPLGRCDRPELATGRIGRGRLATTCGRPGTLCGSLDPGRRCRETQGTRYPMPLRHLRESIPRRPRTTTTGVASGSRGGYGLALGHRRRARARVARPVRLPLQGQIGMRHVRMVRAGTWNTRGRPRVREPSLHVVRRPPRWDPGARRATNEAHRPGSHDASGSAPREVRGGPSAGDGHPVAVRMPFDARPSLCAVDPRGTRGGGRPDPEGGMGGLEAVVASSAWRPRNGSPTVGTRTIGQVARPSPLSLGWIGHGPDLPLPPDPRSIPRIASRDLVRNALHDRGPRWIAARTRAGDRASPVGSERSWPALPMA